MILFFQFYLSPIHATPEVPIPQTVVDRFREKTYLNHRFTRSEARKFIEETNEPIVKALQDELYELTKVHLQRKYAQDAITYEMLQKLMQEQVLESAKESMLQNDRSINSLILMASAQIDPFLPFKASKTRAPKGHLPPFLPLKDPLAMRVNRLEFERDMLDERLANIEKLLLFQEDKINALKNNQETLISWIKLSGYVIVIFQIGKGMNTIFFSPWGQEKVRKSRIFFFQQGEKICLVLLEKFKAQERRE